MAIKAAPKPPGHTPKLPDLPDIPPENWRDDGETFTYKGKLYRVLPGIKVVEVKQ